jgi:hypothetical protein
MAHSELRAAECLQLASALPVGAALRELDLSGNSLTNNSNDFSGWQVFCSQLPLARSLQHLVVAHCSLGAQGGELLASALLPDDAWHCCSLKKLDMSGNELESHGFSLLAGALTPDNARAGVYNTILTSLNLNECGLDANSLSPLAGMLQSNEHLKTLEMKGNLLLDAGVHLASHFATKLKTLSALEVLDLSHNICPGLGGQSLDEGQYTVVRTLVASRSNSLVSLDLSGVAPHPADLLLWARALRDAQPDRGVRVDTVCPHQLSVNLTGCMVLHESFVRNEALLPAVEILLEVSFYPWLQLNADTLKDCRGLHYVRMMRCVCVSLRTTSAYSLNLQC